MASRTTTDVHKGYLLTHPLTYQGTLRNTYGVNNNNNIVRCMQEEIFGPVTCVTVFDTEEEVIERVNNTNYGLCASVWSQSVGRVHRVAQQLEVGTVWSNCWLVRNLDMPFGGCKDSGTGKEGTRHSLELFTEEKTHCIKLN